MLQFLQFFIVQYDDIEQVDEVLEYILVRISVNMNSEYFKETLGWQHTMDITWG